MELANGIDLTHTRTTKENENADKATKTAMQMLSAFSDDTIQELHNRHRITKSWLGLREKVLTLIGVIMERQFQKGRNRTGAELHNSLIRNLLGTRYAPKILKMLATEKLILIDFSYRKGARARRYKIHPRVITSRIVDVPSPKLWLRSHGDDVWSKRRSALLNSNTLEVRNTALLLDQLDMDAVDAAIVKDKARLNCCQFLLRQFKERRFYCVRDPYGRLHSSFTGLPSTYRNQARLDGEQLLELDIRACFPTLLFRLVRDPNEQERYRSWLFDGMSDFYESLASCDDFRVATKDCGNARGRAKSLFNSWLNGGRHCWMIDRAIQSEFPGLYHEVMRVNKDGPGSIGFELMKDESKIVVDGVLTGIWTSNPALPMLSVHDAIYCRARDVAKVYRRLSSEFERSVGVAPVLRIKNLGREVSDCMTDFVASAFDERTSVGVARDSLTVQ